MKEINTFRGTKPLCWYHRVCAHEHLLIDLSHQAITPGTEAETAVLEQPVRMDNLGLLRRNPYVVRDNLILSDAAVAVREVGFLRKHGVDLIIDLTTIGIGRDLEKLRAIAAAIEPDLVIGTGFYTQGSLTQEEAALSSEQMAELMLREIYEGIGDSGIRAGVIGEIGVSEQIYPAERRSLLAAAKAYRESGLPVYVHTYPWTRAGYDAARLLAEHGVDPRDICICHTDVRFDHDYMRALLRLGVYLEFDNFGKEFYFLARDGAFSGGPFASDLSRVHQLRRLLEEGYGRQLMIANDICLKTALHCYGGWGYDHIFENIIPMMRQEGMCDAEIAMIVDENPLCFLQTADTGGSEERK